MVFEQRFCPNCGSHKVEPDNRRTNILGEMIFNPDKWYCRKCDYTGLMPSRQEAEDERVSEDLEFEPRENEKIDSDAGRAYAKYYVFVIILSLVYAVILLLK